MKTLIRVAVGVAVTAGLIPLLASAASGHQPSTATVSCASVSATFTDFGASDHPIVWHVQVGTGRVPNGREAVAARIRRVRRGER